MKAQTPCETPPAVAAAAKVTDKKRPEASLVIEGPGPPIRRATRHFCAFPERSPLSITAPTIEADGVPGESAPVVASERLLTVIPPYWNLYVTNCKLRWRGKRLLEAFTSEFSWKTPQYFLNAIHRGASLQGDLRERENPHSEASMQALALCKKRMQGEDFAGGGFSGSPSPRLFELLLLVNWLPCTADQVLQNGDVIVHNTLVMEILQETPEILCVCKPSGIPVHPQGLYRAQSLLHRLKSFYLKNPDVLQEAYLWTAGVCRRGHRVYLHPINRLDRVTCGLVIFAKNPATARSLTKALAEAGKVYLCRVGTAQVLLPLPSLCGFSEGQSKNLRLSRSMHVCNPTRAELLAAMIGVLRPRLAASVGERGSCCDSRCVATNPLTAEEAFFPQSAAAQQEQEKQREVREAPGPAVAAPAHAAPATDSSACLSGRAQRRAIKQRLKQEKLLLKAEEERRRARQRALRLQFTERPFEITEAAAAMLAARETEAASFPRVEASGAAAASVGAASEGTQAVAVDDTLRVACGAKEAQLLQTAWDEEEGKTAQTVFTQIAFSAENNSSLVLAMPITGRSHQIRKHLKLLGHCIVGDSLYARQRQQKQQKEKQQEEQKEMQQKEQQQVQDTNIAEAESLARGEPAVQDAYYSFERGALKPQEWRVRFCIDEVLHLLPCCCNPAAAEQNATKGEAKAENATGCERSTEWHLNFVAQAVQSAGGQVQVHLTVPPQIEVVYRLEEPDAICLFALFYTFSLGKSTEQGQQDEASQQGGEVTFSSLEAPPPWAWEPLRSLKEPLREALPKLARIKAHVLQQHQSQGVGL
ncbi:RNA pseudouridine synthase superfamily protein [Cyclospora cayetanensis]|uniref:RNA pseudouridine synthase superfamily protein n=1 Tax=Cyclospora cayetanensis TaxID=88456 RepID=A0A1D3CSY9_9EIME|nr:RNA pseudouridine synthase superfamily protein [Cyclospora cayetanensis]